MRAIRVIAGFAGLLLALSACGQPGDQASPASDEQESTSSAPSDSSGSGTPSPAPGPAFPDPTIGKAPPVTVPPKVGGGGGPGGASAAPPADAVLLPAGQVDTSGLPPHYTERNVWSSNGGRTLRLYGMAMDACSNVQGKVGEQTDAAVRVVLLPMATPQGGPADGGMCAQVLTPRLVSVDLRAPVGQRRVYLSEGY